MSNDVWIDMIPSAAKPVVYAYKYRHAIQKYWIKAQISLLKNERPSIIITGRSGVGKSVLAAHYHGEANSLDWNIPNTSTKAEIKPITIGQWTKIVSVIPGQQTAERERALDLALGSDNLLNGVIHVVDWGFTSIRDEIIKKTMVSDGLDTIDKVRKHNLDLELKEFHQTLERIKTSICNQRGPKWLVIALTKIDLYESSIDEAKQYYHPECCSPFAKALNDFYQIVGKNNIKVIIMPVSVMPEKFEWNGMKTLPQIDSITKQRSYLRSFIDNIANLQSTME